MSDTDTEPESESEAGREFSPAWSSYAKSILLALPTCGLSLVWAWWHRRNTSYVVDDAGVSKEYNGLSSSTDRIESGAIKRIETSQGLFEKMRNRGSVRIHDSSGSSLTIKGVTDHEGLVKSLK